MPASMSQAHDQVLALLKGALPASLPIAWPDVAKPPGFPPAAGSWVRVSISDTEPPRPPPLVSSPGSRRYSMAGLLTVELYTLAGDGRRAARELAETVLAAYRGQRTSGGAWFRNERANYVGPDGPWFHTNCIVEFEYDSIQ